MIRSKLFIILIMIVFSVSCSGNEEKLNSSDLIPEKDLVKILTEIHIADGLLPNPKIQNWMVSVDSVSTYYYIIEKHGYTKESMDNTMHYYFIRKPKKLIKIYDRVLAMLSEMESLTEKEVLQAREHADNLWPGSKYYTFPDPSARDSVSFDIALPQSGIYTLKFTATIYPGDHSFNSRATVYTCNADSILTGKREYGGTLNYIKDGLPHNYAIQIINPPKIKVRLRGTLYDFENNPEECYRHAHFENISFSLNTGAV